MFVWLLTALRLPSGVWCYIALHCSSFCFTDPPAPDVGTWPKQLHSNNLEHLSLKRRLNTKCLKLPVIYQCVCVFLCDPRELWHAVWPSSWGGDSSCGQAPGCRGAVCVQHDYTGDRWNQLCHSTGTHTFDLLFSGTASYTVNIHIELNYCYLFFGELFTLSFPPSKARTPFFWNYLLLTM